MTLSWIYEVPPLDFARGKLFVGTRDGERGGALITLYFFTRSLVSCFISYKYQPNNGSQL